MPHHLSYIVKSHFVQLSNHSLSYNWPIRRKTCLTSKSEIFPCVYHPWAPKLMNVWAHGNICVRKHMGCLIRCIMQWDSSENTMAIGLDLKTRSTQLSSLSSPSSWACYGTQQPLCPAPGLLWWKNKPEPTDRTWARGPVKAQSKHT